MDSSYRIIKTPGHGEIEEKKSRFLAEAVFVSSEEEAKERIAEVKKKHYDARHVVSARILGPDGTDMKSTDDGEPSGTAGRPVLEVIKGAELTNCLITVTRYFGGTLLGTGGLVRAYTAAAKAAVEDAKIAQMCLADVIRISFDYSLFDRIRFRLEEEGIRSENESYTDEVSLELKLRKEDSSRVREELVLLTNGRIKIEELGSGYYPL